jgi:hypothetical protein
VVGNYALANRKLSATTQISWATLMVSEENMKHLFGSWAPIYGQVSTRGSFGSYWIAIRSQPAGSRSSQVAEKFRVEESDIDFALSGQPHNRALVASRAAGAGYRQ